MRVCARVSLDLDIAATVVRNAAANSKGTMVYPDGHTETGMWDCGKLIIKDADADDDDDDDIDLDEARVADGGDEDDLDFGGDPEDLNFGGSSGSNDEGDGEDEDEDLDLTGAISPGADDVEAF